MFCIGLMWTLGSCRNALQSRIARCGSHVLWVKSYVWNWWGTRPRIDVFYAQQSSFLPFFFYIVIDAACKLPSIGLLWRSRREGAVLKAEARRGIAKQPKFFLIFYCLLFSALLAWFLGTFFFWGGLRYSNLNFNAYGAHALLWPSDWKRTP